MLLSKGFTSHVSIERHASEIVIFDDTTVYAVKDRESKYWGYTHVSHEKCFSSCSQSNNLVSGPLKKGPICPHKLALATLDKTKNVHKDLKVKYDYKMTSDLSLKSMLTFLPGPRDIEQRNLILRKNPPEDMNIFLKKQFDKILACGNCHENSLESYQYNRKNSCLFLTQTTLMKVTFNSKICEKCRTLNHPDLSEFFLINLRENFNNYVVFI